MTPEQLDAIEAQYREHAPECPFPGEKVMDALREAWAEAARFAADLLVQQRATDEAEAEVERMRRGEVDGIFTSVVHECCSRAQAAEVALDRVRALHTPVHRFGPDGTYTECSCGDYDYPCATIRAIDGSE